MLFAFETIKALEKKGHRLLLWTYREGALLQEAVDFCANNGVVFYAVNENYPGETEENQHCPIKLIADIFIDDRNIGGFIGWESVWQTLHPEGGHYNQQLRNSEAHFNYRKKSKFFSWF